MSQTNLELVRSIYAHWERGDFHPVDWADPDIEWVVADGPAPRRSSGLTGGNYWRDVMDAWEDLRFAAVEYREIDDERVLVLHRFSGRGKTSGLELGGMHTLGANLFHIRDGKVIENKHYFDANRALADLGLGS